MRKIGIISCSTNNLFSVSNVFKELNCLPIISNTKEKLLECDILVLPGVGAFNIAMQNLKAQGLDVTIHDFIKTGKIFLGICLGFQLLFEESDEFTKTSGLGLIKGKVKAFDKKKLIVPHIGWNNLRELQKNSLIENKMNKFYFIHSFFAEPNNKKNILYQTEYNKFFFCSGVKKDNIFGTQFHPEKSGKNGINFLKNLLNES